MSYANFAAFVTLFNVNQTVAREFVSYSDDIELLSFAQRIEYAARLIAKHNELPSAQIDFINDPEFPNFNKIIYAAIVADDVTVCSIVPPSYIQDDYDDYVSMNEDSDLIDYVFHEMNELFAEAAKIDR